MSALLDSLAGGFDGDAARRPALDAALRAGLPGPREEAWKYTSLRALERRAFALAPRDAATVDVDPALLAAIPAPRLVFVNGRFDASLSDAGTLVAGVTFAPVVADAAPTREPRDVFDRLNVALATDGVSIRVDAGVDAGAPLHLVSIATPAAGDLAWHLRHDVRVGAGASLVLVEHALSTGAHRHLDNSAVELDVAAGARLVHARVQADADGATRFLRTAATLAEDADYRRVDLELGAGLSRHVLDVRLAGDRARLSAHGVLLATGRRHVDTRLGIEHLARDTTCELLWRGIGAGRGRAVFHGGITIHAGADGTDAQLSNKNLLLSADAEIDTQPVLVIHADEVKAAHGATVGQLDPTALFYLRSRGLPADAARRLLTAAFVREPLSAVAATDLREALAAALDAAMSGLVDA